MSKLGNIENTNKVRKNLSKRYKDRKGGYTRIIKAGYMDTKMSGGKTPKILTLSTKKVAKLLLKNPYKTDTLDFHHFELGAMEGSMG